MSAHPRTPHPPCSRSELLRARMKRGLPVYGETIRVGAGHYTPRKDRALKHCATCGDEFWTSLTEPPYYCKPHRRAARKARLSKMREAA